MLLGINPNETVESVERGAVVISSAPGAATITSYCGGRLSPEPSVKQLTRLPPRVLIGLIRCPPAVTSVKVGNPMFSRFNASSL